MDHDTPLLLPLDLHNGVPQDHLPHYIIDVVGLPWALLHRHERGTDKYPGVKSQRHDFPNQNSLSGNSLIPAQLHHCWGLPPSKTIDASALTGVLNAVDPKMQHGYTGCMSGEQRNESRVNRSQPGDEKDVRAGWKFLMSICDPVAYTRRLQSRRRCHQRSRGHVQLCGRMKQRLSFVCGSVIAIAFTLLVVSFVTVRNGRTIFGSTLGGDFPAFYVAGSILNHFPSTRLYDLTLQDQIYRETIPSAETGKTLPFANPPFIARLFQPICRLPYALALAVWLILSAILFVAGLKLLGCSGREAWLLALSFEPLLFEAWMGGQLSAIGFSAVAGACWLEMRQRPFLAGMVLAVLWFKLTWLAWIVPVLVFSRRWRMLGGFLLVSVPVVWWAMEDGYLDLLRSYFMAATGKQEFFRTWKFVDVMSCLRSARWVAVVLIIGWGGTLLWQAWRQPSSIWPSTFAGTCVFNIYWGVYDTTLLVAAFLLLRRRIHPGWVIAAWVSPWLSQALHWPVFTVVLFAVAIRFLPSHAEGELRASPNIQHLPV
jgi:hypothetical protein